MRWPLFAPATRSTTRWPNFLFFQIADDKIVFQRGYRDKLTFLRLQDLPIPQE
jgi:hypothetical protein